MKNFLFVLFLSLIVNGCSSNPAMLCQNDFDCVAGYSCRSKSGGGTECRVKSSNTFNSNLLGNCKNDFDCAAGYSCRTKPESGSECRLKSSVTDTTGAVPIQNTPAIPHKESTIENLEEIKMQCAKLFKPKTDKFGKCVLELTK